MLARVCGWEPELSRNAPWLFTVTGYVHEPRNTVVHPPATSPESCVAAFFLFTEAYALLPTGDQAETGEETAVG